MNKKGWLDYIIDYINNNKYKRAISWHIRLDLKEKFNYNTSKINYELSKLVKDGFLNKSTSVYCTTYTLKDEKFI